MEPRYDATGNQYGGVAETTFANYARDVRRLQKYVGDVRLGQMGVAHVGSLGRRMELAGETPENQRTTMVRLSTILNLAEPRGDVAKNFAAARLVKRPKQAKRQHVQPREDDLTRLMQAVDGDPLEALVWIGLGAGLRRAELLGLRWEDVEYLNTDLGVIVVQRRVNYLGKGINRLERDGLKNGESIETRPHRQPDA
jgi:integrase